MRTIFPFCAAGLSAWARSWHALDFGGWRKPCRNKNVSTTEVTKADAASQFCEHSSHREMPKAYLHTCRCTAALAGSRQLSTCPGGTVRLSTYTGFFSDFRGERRAPNQCLVVYALELRLPDLTRSRLAGLPIFVVSLPIVSLSVTWAVAYKGDAYVLRKRAPREFAFNDSMQVTIRHEVLIDVFAALSRENVSNDTAMSVEHTQKY